MRAEPAKTATAKSAPRSREENCAELLAVIRTAGAPGAPFESLRACGHGHGMSDEEIDAALAELSGQGAFTSAAGPEGLVLIAC